MDQTFFLDFGQYYPLSANGQLERSNSGLDFVYATGTRQYYHVGDITVSETAYKNYGQTLYSYNVRNLTLQGQVIASTNPTFDITISDDSSLSFTHEGIALLYVATEGDDKIQWCAIWKGSDGLYYLQRVSVKTGELIGSVIAGGPSLGKMLGDICIAYLLWNRSSATSLNEVKVTTRINNISKEIRFGCSAISGQTCSIGYVPGTTDQQAKFVGVIYATSVPVVADIRTELNRGLSDIEDLKQAAEDSFDELSDQIREVATSLSSDFVAR